MASTNEAQDPVGKVFRSLLGQVVANAFQYLPAIRPGKMMYEWVAFGRWIDRIRPTLQNQ